MIAGCLQVIQLQPTVPYCVMKHITNVLIYPEFASIWMRQKSGGVLSGNTICANVFQTKNAFNLHDMWHGYPFGVGNVLKPIDVY